MLVLDKEVLAAQTMSVKESDRYGPLEASRQIQGCKAGGGEMVKGLRVAYLYI